MAQHLIAGVLARSSAARYGLERKLAECGVEVLTGTANEQLGTADVVLVATDHIDDLDRDGPPSVVAIDELTVDSYVAAFRAGATGAVHIHQSSDIILRALVAASSHEALLPSSLVSAIVNVDGEAPDLTQLEVSLLQALSDGHTLVEVSRAVFMGERTAQRILQSACLKLGARSRAEAIKVAAQRRILK